MLLPLGQMPRNLTLNYGNVVAPMAIGTLTVAAAGNTVNYNGTTQNVSGLNYYNLSISGSGTKTLLAATTVNAAGVLTLNSGVLEIGTFNLTINNTATNAIQGTYGETSMIGTDNTGYVVQTCATLTSYLVPNRSSVSAFNYYSPVLLHQYLLPVQ